MSVRTTSIDEPRASERYQEVTSRSTRLVALSGRARALTSCKRGDIILPPRKRWALWRAGVKGDDAVAEYEFCTPCDHLHACGLSLAAAISRNFIGAFVA